MTEEQATLLRRAYCAALRMAGDLKHEGCLPENWKTGFDPARGCVAALNELMCELRIPAPMSHGERLASEVGRGHD